MMLSTLFFTTLLLVRVSTQHIINARLINGRNAFRNQFPFMASIQLCLPVVLTCYHICSGAAIHKDWILSSGVCVNKLIGKIDRARVKIGIYFATEQGNSIQIIKVRGKICHEDFDVSSTLPSNNIGLIHLETSIDDPILVKISQPEPILTAELFMIGWGRVTDLFVTNLPEVLQYAKVFLLNNVTCMANLSEYQQTVQLQDSSHLCINSPESAITASAGDDGGPVIRYVNDKPEFVGVITWAFNPDQQVGVPTICVNVSHFSNWISKEIALPELADYDSENDDMTISLLKPR